MALDNAQYIDELSITDPTATDPVSEGDDQIRAVKRAVKQSFPSVDIASNAIHTSATEPSVSVTEGLVWIDTSAGAGNHVAKIYDGSAFIILPFSVETAKTVDIDGGAIDGTVIGGATPAAISGTTLSGSTSLALATGATVTGVDNGALGTSATLLATQGAIKTYVDAQITAEDLDITTDSGTIDIDLDSETLTVAGGSGLDTAASSTTVTVNVTDGGVTNAKLADMAAGTVKVRDAGSSGVPSDVALTTTQILIGDGAGVTAASLSGDVTMTNAGVVTVAKIQGEAVSSTSAANDQYLKYSTSSNEWQKVNVVGDDKLTTKGDLLAYNTVDSETRFGVGTDTHVLTADSGATNGFDWAVATVPDGAVTNAKMADMAANTVKVRDANSSGVPSDVALATTEILIGDGTGFTAAALSSDVTMTNAGAVTIANNAVTLAKLEDGTQGDVLYYAASGAPTRLGFGTDGYFLKTQGTGANPVWAEVSTGTAWQSVTTGATLTAVAGRGYPINTTSNVCTVTLPASASVGDTIEFVDYAGTWATNKVTLDPQSLKLKGSTDDLSLTYERQGVRIVYVDATQGWVAATGVNETNPAITKFSGSGGTETTYSDGGNDYTTHTFTSSGTFTASGIPGLIDVMLVGGGGGGINSQAGGGGGGGMITMVDYTAALGDYTIVIGAGGTGSSSPSDGVSTTGFGETCTGGGKGGKHPGNGGPGANGGGGGVDAASTGGVGTAPSVVSGTATGRGGNNGGTGDGSCGAGGGGANGAGTNAGPPSSSGGDGGAGLQWNLDGNNYYWAGGGGGASYFGSAGDGGIGGGGAATWWAPPCAGAATATQGTPGGSAINDGAQAIQCGTGGAGGANSGGGGACQSANGGSGIVQIRYIT